VCPRCAWDEAAPGTQPVALPPGAVLNDQYVVGRMLGHGGFGITYLAWDRRLETRVAIKEFLPRDHAARSTMDGRSVAVYQGESEEHFAYGLRKFLDEARNLARFAEHPSIVTVLSYFEANATAYMVMQYVDGEDLKSYMRRVGGRLPPHAALGVIGPVLDALRAVHDAGLLHRDVAPDNIYITSTGRIILLDFGAAKDALGSHSRSLAAVHKEGFSPEEQYRVSGQQGPYTDIYAAAATLYCMLTGRVPPDAMERLELDELAPPSRLGIALEPHQEAALLKALAVRGADRYQDVRSFQSALSTSPPPPPPPPGPAPVGPHPGPATSRSNAWLVVALSGLGLVLAGFLALEIYKLVNPATQPLPVVQSPPPSRQTGSDLEELYAQQQREKDELRRRRDQEAFDRAQSQDTIPAYEEYLARCASTGCLSAQAARAKIEELRARIEELRRIAVERERQERLQQAANEVSEAVYEYFGLLKKADAEGAASMWIHLKNPAGLKADVEKMTDASVIRIEPIDINLFLETAAAPVYVRVTNTSTGTQCWKGKIRFEKDGGTWKIRTQSGSDGLKAHVCP
jgi:serine/threonine protein kinase